MGTTSTSRSDRTFGYTAVAAVLVGLLVAGFGLLLVPQSVLGGLWIAAIGLSVLLAGVFSTTWAGQQLGVSDGNRRTLTISFVAVAVLLAVAFAVINGLGSIESAELTASVPAL
ncbi:hypothetical protein [Halosimplex pelagicum]|uniref:Uncharacterized protein n=1 Tax=Halosimplex pelagicum TaxID=869886 RepID=A0A7D5P5N9_9EURY|nr:hypothetical protein [Halosimplex pelagicum]QLH81443.1 hypothetical protein HZS54_07300 [Halosimplex pelagicum]